MSYIVLARKYRPASFSSVQGQEHVTRSLANAIKREKIGQAYVLSGPRGVGKTSIARILAKSLNCQKGPTSEPCLECSNCKEISAGTSLAVWEIDGASHNSVDNVRELIDSFRSSPPPGYRFKLYIIDEVHMLSVAAFNALLKSLEEPPPNTVFILATTEVHKIPETVLSRCQRFDLRALAVGQIEDQLKKVAEKESISIEDESLRLIARAADGSMRDAETLLERVHSYCDGIITAQETSQVLGTVAKPILFALSQAVVAHDASKVLSILGEVFASGTDEASFIRELVGHWREIFLAKLSRDDDLKSLGIREDSIVDLKRLSSANSFEDIQDLYRIIREGCDAALRSSHVKLSIEALLVRATYRRPVQDIARLLEALEKTDSFQSSASIPRAPVVAAVQPKAVSTAVPASVPIKPALVETPQSVATAPTAGSGTPLDFEKFIQFTGSKGAKMLAEQLKKTRTKVFAGGDLILEGPEFSLSSIKRDSARMKELLLAFAEGFGLQQFDWRLTFQPEKPGTSAAMNSQESGSATSVMSHPAIQSVQKFFPGSRVEAIKDKV